MKKEILQLIPQHTKDHKKDYYELLYANKLDNSEEASNILERHNFLRLNHEVTKNLNRPILSKKIESLINNLPTNKSPGPDGFRSRFH